MRRFVVHWRLYAFVTLTFAREPRDRADLVRLMGNWLRGRLARRHGDAFPWVYVPEHGDGRWHVHVFLPLTITRDDVCETWRHEDSPTYVVCPNVSVLREKVDYTCKEFVSVAAHKRRYVPARGYPVPREQDGAPNMADGVRRAVEAFGGELPQTTFETAPDAEGWRPSVVTMLWGT
jgi:hypothetical protein